MQQFKNFLASSNLENDNKHHLIHNSQNKFKTLTTNFGSVKFDVLIGYSNQSLVCIYKSILVCYNVDKSLLNSIELFEKLNKIISDQIILSNNQKIISNNSLQTNVELQNTNKVQKKIFDLTINSGESIGSIKIYFFENINTYLLITNNCAFHFNEIVGYNISTTSIKITCLYESHVVDFHLDAIFLNCVKLYDFFNSLLS